MPAHVARVRTYVWIWIALILLLLLTFGSAYLSLGVGNLIANLGIAIAKALLVAIFFMHLRRSNHVLWLGAVAGLFFLFILLGLTLNDFLTRGWMPG